MQTVCVMGMGYVGLTLSTVLARKGFTVHGIEKKADVLSLLKQGKPHFHEKGLSELLAQTVNSKLFFSADIPKNQPIDVFIITVGTPIDHVTNLPIMDQIEDATRMVATAAGDEALVVLRSTVPIGITRQIVNPILASTGKNIHVAFCPERTVEGKAIEETETLPQVVGGLTPEATTKAAEFFSHITNDVIPVSSAEAAELTKLLNNSWRDVTFAFANEISFYCEMTKLNAKEVIDAANYKYGRSSIPTPGFVSQKVPSGGFVGGFCLRKDPHILINSASQIDVPLHLIRTAREINQSIPAHVVETILKANPNLNQKIFVLGFAYKGEPETDDMRDSPTLEVINILKKKGISSIWGHDFLITKEKIEETGGRFALLEDGFSDADAVIFCTNGKRYAQLQLEKLTSKMKPNGVIFDTWHLFSPQHAGVRGKKYYSIGLSSK